MLKFQLGHWSAIEAAVLTVLTIIVWGLFSLPAVFYFVLADNKVYILYFLRIYVPMNAACLLHVYDACVRCE